MTIAGTYYANPVSVEDIKLGDRVIDANNTRWTVVHFADVWVGVRTKRNSRYTRYIAWNDLAFVRCAK